MVSTIPVVATCCFLHLNHCLAEEVQSENRHFAGQVLSINDNGFVLMKALDNELDQFRGPFEDVIHSGNEPGNIINCHSHRNLLTYFAGFYCYSIKSLSLALCSLDSAHCATVYHNTHNAFCG